jgi:hypothetical protein
VSQGNGEETLRSHTVEAPRMLQYSMTKRDSVAGVTSYILTGDIRSGVHFFTELLQLNICHVWYCLSSTQYNIFIVNTAMFFLHTFVPSYVTALVTVYSEAETDRRTKETTAFVTHTAIGRHHYKDRTVTTSGVIAVYSYSHT